MGLIVQKRSTSDGSLHTRNGWWTTLVGKSRAPMSRMEKWPGASSVSEFKENEEADEASVVWSASENTTD